MIILFNVVRTIRKGCNGAVIFAKGMEVDLDPLNRKVNRWIAEGWIREIKKEVKSDVHTEIHNNQDVAGHHDERTLSD